MKDQLDDVYARGGFESEGEQYKLRVGPYVEAVPDHHMPEWVELEACGFDEPDVCLRIELRDGIPRLVDLRFRAGPNSREVMAKDLRDHDLSGFVETFYGGLVIRVDRGDGKTIVRQFLDPETQFSRQIHNFLRQRRSGKRRITGDFLARVAEVYRNNIDHAPTEAVAKTFGVKHRQATDYVKQARDRGWLPPTKQGRAKA
jgi:hypothetical protein